HCPVQAKMAASRSMWRTTWRRPDLVGGSCASSVLLGPDAAPGAGSAAAGSSDAAAFTTTVAVSGTRGDRGVRGRTPAPGRRPRWPTRLPRMPRRRLGPPDGAHRDRVLFIDWLQDQAVDAAVGRFHQ